MCILDISFLDIFDASRGPSASILFPELKTSLSTPGPPPRDRYWRTFFFPQVTPAPATHSLCGLCHYPGLSIGWPSPLLPPYSWTQLSSRGSPHMQTKPRTLRGPCLPRSGSQHPTPEAFFLGFFLVFPPKMFSLKPCRAGSGNFLFI